ncbi:MAG: hypothetical protein LBR74_05820 [Eubacterium sp.]|jgi:hypothetical protein|nr:hypothetical protein [Eubacterium sp.]
MKRPGKTGLFEILLCASAAFAAAAALWTAAATIASAVAVVCHAAAFYLEFNAAIIFSAAVPACITTITVITANAYATVFFITHSTHSLILIIFTFIKKMILQNM